VPVWLVPPTVEVLLFLGIRCVPCNTRCTGRPRPIPGEGFQTLWDKVLRRDVGWRAWVAVRRNDGALGIDKLTLDAVEECGIDRFLAEIESELRERRYRPLPARQVLIPKPGQPGQVLSTARENWIWPTFGSSSPTRASGSGARNFGQTYANGLRYRRAPPGDKWHLDEVFIRIAGKTHYLWRAVDQRGTVLDILVTSRRDANATTRFFRKLLTGLEYVPRVLLTDKLASYGVARRRLMPGVEHRRSKYLNNRAENSH
jgi:hypothetical protein